MEINGGIASKIGSAVKAPLVFAGSFLANGSHAAQPTPAQTSTRAKNCEAHHRQRTSPVANRILPVERRCIDGVT